MSTTERSRAEIENDQVMGETGGGSFAALEAALTSIDPQTPEELWAVLKKFNSPYEPADYWAVWTDENLPQSARIVMLAAMSESAKLRNEVESCLQEVKYLQAALSKKRSKATAEARVYHQAVSNASGFQGQVKQVMDLLRGQKDSWGESGLKIDDIQQKLNCGDREALQSDLDYLVSEGHLYNTTNEDCRPSAREVLLKNLFLSAAMSTMQQDNQAELANGDRVGPQEEDGRLAALEALLTKVNPKTPQELVRVLESCNVPVSGADLWSVCNDATIPHHLRVLLMSHLFATVKLREELEKRQQEVKELRAALAADSKDSVDSEAARLHLQAYVNASGFQGRVKHVMELLSQKESWGEAGLQIDDIQKKLNRDDPDALRTDLDALVAEGHLYNTRDDDWYCAF